MKGFIEYIREDNFSDAKLATIIRQDAGSFGKGEYFFKAHDGWYSISQPNTQNEFEKLGKKVNVSKLKKREDSTSLVKDGINRGDELIGRSDILALKDGSVIKDVSGNTLTVKDGKIISPYNDEPLDHWTLTIGRHIYLK